MSQVKVFARKAKSIARSARDLFFGIKTRREDFGGYLPMNSRMQPVREALPSVVIEGGRKFTRYDYEPVRRARPGV